MRVLMIVQLVDEREWLRAFTVDWIRALAAQVEQVDVLTLELGEARLPDNVRVRSMGKERGYSRPRELWAYYCALAAMVRDADVIFSHMTPRYTWLATPLAALTHTPQMLWFTHRQDSLELRLALRAARWITTATADSFPIVSPKVHVMGHGIAPHLFAPGDPPPDDPPLVLAVGRITPIKHHATLLDAAARLRDEHGAPPVRFAIAGTMAVPGDDAHYQHLLQRRAALGLSEVQFSFLGPLHPSELVTTYRRATVVTNLSPPGSFDKSVLEALLTATPVITPNPAFSDVLGEHRAALMVAGPEDAAGVARQIAGLLALSPAQRAAMGADLRAGPVQQHTLDRLMRDIAALMRQGVNR
jgi:glycosyltransferase involved in cell wall biosynthesis